MTWPRECRKFWLTRQSQYDSMRGYFLLSSGPGVQCSDLPSEFSDLLIQFFIYLLVQFLDLLIQFFPHPLVQCFKCFGDPGLYFVDLTVKPLRSIDKISAALQDFLIQFSKVSQRPGDML